MGRQLKTTDVSAGEAGKALPLRRQLRDPAVPMLGLLTALQASLDPQDVLDTFNGELRTVVRFDGLHFAALNGTETCFGTMARCRLVYRMALDGSELGELILTRRTPFAPSEISIVEECLGLLLPSLRNALAHQEALASARRDPLTHLGNRRAMEESLNRELDLAKRHREDFSIVLMDVDDFKVVNDRYGHQAGDAVLRDIGSLITASARDSDLLFRYAGDEFLVAMSRTAQAGALQVAERLRQSVEGHPFAYSGEEILVKVSVGLSTATSSDDSDSLFARADRSLFRAKRSGRNCCVAEQEPRDPTWTCG